MAGTMALADLVADLKASLHDTASVFEGEGEDAEVVDASFRRFLVQALPDMQLKRPLTRLGGVDLMAGLPRYSLANCPDFAAYKTHLWGGCMPKPWEPGYPGALPRVEAVRDAGMWWLVFDPAPTWRHIGTFSATFRFYYFGQHTLGALDAGTTIAAEDRGLLLLRAQVEAMRELAMRNASKVVSMRDGVSGTPRNSTPAAMHEMLMRLFQESR